MSCGDPLSRIRGRSRKAVQQVDQLRERERPLDGRACVHDGGHHVLSLEADDEVAIA